MNLFEIDMHLSSQSFSNTMQTSTWDEENYPPTFAIAGSQKELQKVTPQDINAGNYAPIVKHLGLQQPSGF